MSDVIQLIFQENSGAAVLRMVHGGWGWGGGPEQKQGDLSRG